MAGGQEAADGPRALCLAASDRAIIVGRLARAVLRFQDDFLSRDSSPAGLLCQVWLPDVVDDNQIVLKTKGMPFCVAGLGDLLALFRCISCRFAFGTNVARPNTLGAPGRVFTSSEPEMCCNVQQYAKQQYLRRAEAEQCQVQSTLLLPLFISPKRSGCVGVLEVVQTSQDMRFADVAALLATALEKCELYTCSLEAVQRRAPAATTTTLLLPPEVGVLERPPSDNAPLSDDSQAGAAGGERGGEAGGGGGAPGARAAGAAAAGGESDDDMSAGEEDEGEDEDEEDEDEEGGAGRRRGGATKSAGSRARRKGIGNPGKPGVRLTLADLQGQFGVGLKEAAARLGICPTTLKRACRRHGIQRWPRRQLQKVNRALDELEARQMMQPQQHLLGMPGVPMPPAAFGAGDGGLAADSRWTTLAQFIPAYHSGAGLTAPFQEAQFQQGLLSPYGVTVQQVAPPPAAPHPQAFALAAAQQQQQQQQQALYLQQQRQQQQAAALAGMQPAPSAGASLPDGALAMPAGGGAGRLQEVSMVSGVSTLGQPPSQQPQPQQQQAGAAPTATTAAAPPQPQTSGGSSGGGAPKAADYLQRVAATSNYVSPFTAAARQVRPISGPVVSLPGGTGVGAARGLSSISVPSLNVDMMPPLGPSSLPDDEQVGFMDSSVLELLISEDTRALAAATRHQQQQQLLQHQQSNGGGMAGGGMAAGMAAPDLSAFGSLSLPGLSGGAGHSSMSFML